MDRLVLSLTNEGDSVLDPYMGVGTTVIAAAKPRRRGYGCDMVNRDVGIASD